MAVGSMKTEGAGRPMTPIQWIRLLAGGSLALQLRGATAVPVRCGAAVLASGPALLAWPVPAN